LINSENSKLQQVKQDLSSRDVWNDPGIDYNEVASLTSQLILGSTESSLEMDEATSLIDEVVDVQVVCTLHGLERRTVLSISGRERLGLLLHKACNLWSLSEDSFMVSFQGTLVSKGSRLVDVIRASGSKTAPKFRIISASKEIVVDEGIGEDDLSVNLLEKISSKKDKKLPHLETASIIRDFLLYLILFICAVISFYPVFESAQNMMSTTYPLYGSVLDLQVLSDENIFKFQDIKSISLLNAWVSNVLAPFLFLAGQNCSAVKYWMPYEGVGEIIGIPEFRQLRVRNNASCSVPATASQNFSACYSVYSEATRAVLTFGTADQEFSRGYNWNSSAEYATSLGLSPSDLSFQYLANTAISNGALTEYPLSGYPYELGIPFRKLGDFCLARLQFIHFFETIFKGWITESTAALLISYNMYIGGADLIMASQFTFETTLSGSLIPTFDFALMKASPYWDFSAADGFAVVVLFLILTRNIFVFKSSIRNSSLKRYLVTLETLVDFLVIALYITLWVFISNASQLQNTLVDLALSKDSNYVALISISPAILKVQWVTQNLIIVLGMRLLGIGNLFHGFSFVLNIVRVLAWQTLTVAVYLLFPVIGIAAILRAGFSNMYSSCRDYWSIFNALILRLPYLYEQLLSPSLMSTSYYLPFLVTVTVYIAGYLLQAAVFGGARWSLQQVRKNDLADHFVTRKWELKYIKDVGISVFSWHELIRNRNFETKGK